MNEREAHRSSGSLRNRTLLAALYILIIFLFVVGMGSSSFRSSRSSERRSRVEVWI